MEISVFSVVAWLFGTLGGISGIALLLIKLFQLSAPADGKITSPDDEHPVAAATLRALADGKIDASEAAQIAALLVQLKAKKG